MKMKTRLASLLVMLATSGPLLSATELDRLRALCAEQELQIAQLETKIARLTDTPPPSRSNPSDAPNEEPISENGTGTYTVKAGDNIERIARQQGTSATLLARLNGIETDSIIHPGQKLKLPGKDSSVASSPAPSNRTHTVASGDTFFKISRKYGVSVDELIAANPAVNHNALRIGQKVKINDTQASAPVAKKDSTERKQAPSLSSTPSLPVSNDPTPLKSTRTSQGPIKIDKEVTYGDFAKTHNTTTRRLDELNGLELDSSTVLAQGSELYIPAQP